MIDTITLVIILAVIIFVFYVGQKIGEIRKNREWEKILPNYRKEAIIKSRSIIGGQFSENLAPYLPDFPYLPTECRFLGKPTDFIVFKGMDDKKISEVIFVEVKSGNSKISSQEKNLKEAIENKKVKYEEYRIPKEITKKDGMEFDEDGSIK